MADDRHAQEIADARREADDARARRQQARDAARIQQELADTDRIAAAIDELLDEAEPRRNA
jgi:hypothetical protein